MNVQRYKVGYYSDEWGMSSNTPCLLKDDNGYAVKFEDYEQLRQRVHELTAERDKVTQYWQIAEGRCDALKQQRDELVEAATMAVEMIEYDKHERRHVRWKLQDAIASVKEMK